MLTVSVVIPTYNCQQYLAQAIESALHASVVEIIVIDDGSTDATKEVVDEVERTLLKSASVADLGVAKPKDTESRTHVVRYIPQSNQGVSAARNRGIDEATGDLIAFLDADDWFFPEKLSKQLACFEADADLDIVQSGWQRVDKEGRLLKPIKPWEFIPELTLETFLRFKPVLPSALLIRRACLAETKFDTELAAAEDVDLMSRLLLKGYRAGWAKDVLVSYRQHGQNAMGNSLTQARDLNKFLDNFFAQTELPEHVRMLERSIRYYTLVWAAGCLQSTGHFKEMAQQLKRAWQYSPHLPAEALIYWMDSFETFRPSSKPTEGKTADSHRTEFRAAPAALLASDEWQQLVRWLLVQRR